MAARVVQCQRRVVASLEAGRSRRWAIMASTAERWGEGCRSSSWGRERRRKACRSSTWPWGRELTMEKAWSGLTLVLEQLAENLGGGPRGEVGDGRADLLPSRQPWRRRMAGGGRGWGRIHVHGNIIARTSTKSRGKWLQLEHRISITCTARNLIDKHFRVNELDPAQRGNPGTSFSPTAWRHQH